MNVSAVTLVTESAVGFESSSHISIWPNVGAGDSFALASLRVKFSTEKRTGTLFPYIT